MKRSIVPAAVGDVRHRVAARVHAGGLLFVMMERQLFAELRATLDTRTKVAEMIVSHATTAMRGRLMQEKLADLEPPDARRLLRSTARIRFPLRHAVDGVPVGAPFGAFQRYALNHSTYDDDEDRHGGR